MVSSLHHEMGASRNGNSENPVVNYVNSPPTFRAQKGPEKPSCLCFCFGFPNSTNLNFLLCLLVDIGEDTGPMRKRRERSSLISHPLRIALSYPSNDRKLHIFQLNTKILTLLDIIGISRYISTI